MVFSSESRFSNGKASLPTTPTTAQPDSSIHPENYGSKESSVQISGD
jgi:hypothetical protein